MAIMREFGGRNSEFGQESKEVNSKHARRGYSYLDYRSELADELEEDKIIRRERMRAHEGDNFDEIGNSRVEAKEESRDASMNKMPASNPDSNSDKEKRLQMEIIDLKEDKIDLNHARSVESFRADLYRDNPLWSLFKSNTDQAKQLLSLARTNGLIDFKKELTELDKNLSVIKDAGRKVREAGIVYVDDETKMEITQKLVGELMAIKIALEGGMEDKEK